MPELTGAPAVITPENYPEFMGRASGHTTRHGRDLAAYFEVEPAPEALIYEVFEVETEGHIDLALTVLKPGKVGREYYMTKGHFHRDDEAGEVYFCLKGRGYVLMQTRGGRTHELGLKPGTVAHIPPGWAHRTVNVGPEALIVLAAYPKDSGHDYESILSRGFLRRVVEENGQPRIV